MASRINRMLGHPFRKSKTDGLTKVKSEAEEYAEEQDEKAEKKSAHSSHHSIESKGIHAEPTTEAKIDYSAEWTRCSCCLKELPQRQNQVNCVPTAPVRSCSNCQGCLCKTCRVKGICHECTVRREIKLDPDVMMEYDEDMLRSIIHKLHYPPGGFHNCPKPFLVKQILVRFQMFDDWDPKKVVTPVEHLMPTAVHRLDELEEQDITHDCGVIRMNAVPVHHVGSKGQSTETDERESEPLTPERITVFQAEVERAIRLREERRLAASDEPQAAAASEGVDNDGRSSSGHQHEAHQHKGEHLVEENGHREPHKASRQHDNQLEVVELKDITSMADIKQLHKRQLKRILKEADVDHRSMNGRHEYQQAVAQLWNIYQLNERGPSASNSSPGMKSDSAVNSGESVKAHKQLHRLQYKSQQHPSSSKNNGSSVVLLRDLPATSFAEQMSTEQLQEILVYHNFDPAEYPERGDLVYAVLCLWHAIRRGTPQIVKEINRRPQNLNINTAKTQVAIKELASPIDIEKLDPIQLRNILSNNGVDPDQYETDQELYLGVVNLWSEVQDKQSSNSNVQSSRTVAETAKAVSKWLQQDQNSNAPLARIDEDITFIDDDEASDYEAIDGRISSDSE